MPEAVKGLNELKSALTDAVSKMDAATAGLAKIEELETIVVDDRRAQAKTKQELDEAVQRLDADLEKLPKKIREDFKNYLDLTPVGDVDKLARAGDWQDLAKMSDDEFEEIPGADNARTGLVEGVKFRKSFESPGENRARREKSALMTEGVPGAMSQPVLYNEAIVGDPWVAAGAFQMQASQGRITPVKASGVAFSNETAVDATKFDSVVGTLAEGTDTAIKNYVCRLAISRQQETDLAGTISYLERLIQLAYGKSRGGLTTAAVVAGIKSANDVTTGGANTALAATNSLAKLLALTTAGNVSDYWPNMPAFVLHPSDFTVLTQELYGKSGLNLNPANGLMRLGGWDIAVDNQAETNATDGKFPDFFGSWMDALLQVQRGRLTIDRYEQTIPGATAIYASFRFLPFVINNEAYAGIKVGA